MTCTGAREKVSEVSAGLPSLWGAQLETASGSSFPTKQIEMEVWFFLSHPSPARSPRGTAPAVPINIRSRRMCFKQMNKILSNLIGESLLLLVGLVDTACCLSELCGVMCSEVLLISTTLHLQTKLEKK